MQVGRVRVGTGGGRGEEQERRDRGEGELGLGKQPGEGGEKAGVSGRRRRGGKAVPLKQLNRPERPSSGSRFVNRLRTRCKSLIWVQKSHFAM